MHKNIQKSENKRKLQANFGTIIMFRSTFGGNVLTSNEVLAKQNAATKYMNDRNPAAAAITASSTVWSSGNADIAPKVFENSSKEAVFKHTVQCRQARAVHRPFAS